MGLLENSNCNISIASNGKEAIDIYNKQKDNIDLILMDMQMPIMDGISATKIIRETNSEIPIIALTANAMKEDKDRSKEAGMNEHLNKPIDVDKLYSTLSKYLYNKTDSKASITNIEDINIPEFKNIDKTIGLSHMGNNEKLYTKILNDFIKDYKNITLENLNENEFDRTIHTLKGLSANIGAIELNKIAIELESTQDTNILPKLYDELEKIINEIKENQQNKKPTIQLQILSSGKRDELFSKLKEAVDTKRVKKCEPIIKEIEQYTLEKKDKEVFAKVKYHIEEFEFKEAIKILKEI